MNRFKHVIKAAVAIALTYVLCASALLQPMAAYAATLQAQQPAAETTGASSTQGNSAGDASGDADDETGEDAGSAGAAQDGATPAAAADEDEEADGEDAAAPESLDTEGEQAADDAVIGDSEANSWRYQNGELRSDLQDDNATDLGVESRSMHEMPEGATLQGIDASGYQKDIDWQKVKDAGIDFAILKIGNINARETDGWYTDSYFQRNVTECERLGIPYGVYTYSYAKNADDAVKGADHIIALLKGHNPTLPVYLDLEDNSIKDTDHAAIAKAFCSTISAAGYAPGIYASASWFKNILTDPCFSNSGWGIWTAQYWYGQRYDASLGLGPEYPAKFDCWQYSFHGSVPGVSGDVDMNYAYVDVPLYYWQLKDGTWYYATADGGAYTGWLRLGGAWYWLEPGAGGAMATGLHECNGSMYWFSASGAMATGWVHDGGTWYYASGSGALASGWLSLGGAWYWLDPSTHAMATGLHECNGSMYWFSASGAMATGWVHDGGTWYYASGSGALARGPVPVGGVTYCFDSETGAMLTGYQADAQGVRRYFGNYGPLNGWGLVDGTWYWFSDGIASTGWLFTGGAWYWLEPGAGGAMATGLHECNGSMYWFSASGAMATGWVHDGGTWYYASGSGALASGWLSLGGAWYWLDPSTHAMATGVQQIDGVQYYFASNGVWLG